MNDLRRGERLATANQKPGDEFYRPRSALWWFYLISCALCGIALAVFLWPRVAPPAGTLLLTSPLSLGGVALFVLAMAACDPYRARRPRIMLAAFVSGATIAAYLSVKVNAALPVVVLHLLGEQSAQQWFAGLVGPTSEEWMKTACILLVMLIARETMTRPMHGLMVGGFVGLGFQVLENLSYLAKGALDSPDSDIKGLLLVGFVRFFSGFTSHQLYSAIIGVGVAVLLGRVVGDKWSLNRRLLVFTGFYALGWFIHFLWNSPAPTAWGNAGVIALMPVKIACYLAMLTPVLRWVWRQERDYLRAAASAVTGDQLDELENAAIGDRRTRRSFVKETRRRGGRSGVRRARHEMRIYLERLQEWGRCSAGADTPGIRKTL
ncbi:PrsW family intramembrane metalloprotease [Austwickia chelonae]|uniref:PrsW family intramembrane metalloprotease n=1 Tax=Austwickia chelonae TaxID=100225 RepID=UPI000E2582ED|nr:PrsW family intramembrane metalloprotease [Austwickia chelonae]